MLADCRIPDLTTSLVELLQYPGLDWPVREWWPVTQELPMPRGVGSDLLPLVRQIQDQYLTELQRVNALCQQHSNRCIESLRKHAQQERPVTVWECSVHLDATQRKVK
jgi:predicted solute-binding protein